MPLGAVRVAVLSGGTPTSSDVNVSAWIAAVGSTNTNQNEVNIFTTLVTSGKANGWWPKLDRLWIYAPGTAMAASISLVGPAAHTLVNSPTFTANKGYTGDGSSSLINTGYNISTGTNYVQNSACYGVWVQANDSRTTGNPVYIGSNTANFSNFSRNSATQTNYSTNNGAAADNATMNPTNGIGLQHAERSSGLISTLYHNGVSVNSNVGQASAAPNNLVQYVLALNGAGTASNWNNGTVGASFFGGSMGATIAANFYTDLHTALHSLSATNFP